MMLYFGVLYIGDIFINKTGYNKEPQKLPNPRFGVKVKVKSLSRPDPGIEPRPPALQLLADAFLSEPPGKSRFIEGTLKTAWLPPPCSDEEMRA